MKKTIALPVLALLIAGCSTEIGDEDFKSRGPYPTPQAACASMGADETFRWSYRSAICYKNGKPLAVAYVIWPYDWYVR